MRAYRLRVLIPVCLALTCPPAGAEWCTQPPSGLVAWWPGDGNTDDVHGGNQGVAEGNLTYAPGLVGQAFQFDGASAYIRVPHNPSLAPPEMTIEAWIKPTAPIHYAAGIATRMGYSLEFATPPNVCFWTFLASGWQGCYPGEAPMDQWTHVAGVFAGGCNTVYINGNPIRTWCPGYPLQPIESEFWIGNTIFSSERFFHGLIDELKIFNRGLSAPDIREIYLAGPGGNCQSTQRSGTPAKLFAVSYERNEVYRYDVTPTGPPVRELTITDGLDRPFGVALSSSGELFVSNRSVPGAGSISRILNATDTPQPNGILASPDFNFPASLTFRAGELFVAQAYGQNVLRFGFDAAGNALPNGMISNLPSIRGITVSPWGELFVTECCQYGGYIYRFVVDAAGNVSPNGTITGSEFRNTHGMAFSPWGELFIVNTDNYAVSRLSFDSARNATYNGVLPGNPPVPIGVAFSPWGELFVSNAAGGGAIWRYVFDSSHNAIPNGSFYTPSAVSDLVFSPVSAPGGNAVKLLDSAGNGISGGVVDYYSGGWHSLGTTGSDGSLPITLEPGTYTFRMTYAFASVQKSQDLGADPTVVFQTRDAVVQLKDSHDVLLDGGTVDYYSGGWHSIGAAAGGSVTKELLPTNYTFRMNYGFLSTQKAQNIASDATVVFQTQNTVVQLKDSQGAPLEGGTVDYYSGGWHPIGAASGGSVAIELLPASYTFRMNYAFASVQKTQNIASDPTVLFETQNAVVQLKNSQDAPLEGGTVDYYSGGWHPFGAASGGRVAKELLPASYTFRMNYAFASVQKAQNITSDPTVLFQTQNAVVQLKDSQGASLDGDTVDYYSGGWHPFGAAIGGSVTKELLPASYTFRMNYAFASVQKPQNIDADPIVVFRTQNAMVRLNNSDGIPLDGGTVDYYSGGWHPFGAAAGGSVAKQLLPASYTFRMNYAFASVQKAQNISTELTVDFQTGRVDSDSNTCTSYYSGGWRPFTDLMQLLPGTYTFRFAESPDASSAVAAATTNHIY